MTALGNSRTLLPVEYPLSSLTWSDAAAAAAGYNYPSSGSSAAHHLVYGSGRLVNGPHPYTSPGGGRLGVPESSCSMYNSWRHHPHSPLSFYYQPEAEWFLRQSKLESQHHPFSHHQHQQQEAQRWKSTTDNAVPPRREVVTTSTAANRPSSISSLLFDLTGTGSAVADNTSHDGSSGSCAAALSPVMDPWTTAGKSSVTTIDQYKCRSQGQRSQDTRSGQSHTGLSFRLFLRHVSYSFISVIATRECGVIMRSVASVCPVRALSRKP